MHKETNKNYVTALGLMLITCLTGSSLSAKTNANAPTDEFIKGFKHELSNRAFALRTAERLSKRLEGDEQHTFWQAYLKLEQFNLLRYQAAAFNWDLDSNTGWWPEIKAWIVSWAPSALMEPALKATHASTVRYVETLRSLQQIGPADSQDFLNYMVAQEILQVEMMELALRGEYAEIMKHVDDFIYHFK